MTLYPAGTVINCNRCDKTFTLAIARWGSNLSYDEKFPNQAVRLQEFVKCPHCNMFDTHWVYARNNPRTPEIEFKVSLLEITFETDNQASYMLGVMRANNIPTRLWRGDTLRFENAPDAEAAILLIAKYIKKRQREPR